MRLSSIILATGSYLPDNIIDNSSLTQFPSSFLPLIEQKTGVKSRRFAAPDQCTSDLAIEAANRCLKKAKLAPEQVDAIILTTSSPDRIQPATATRVQDKIGADQAYAFDLNSVCSGGIFALKVADSLIKEGSARNVLVVGAEIYSKYLDPKDFSTFPYFGDGAGAVLLSGAAHTDRGLIHSLLKSDGSKAEAIQVPAGGTMLPYSQLKNPKDIYFKMMGRDIFDFAVTRGSEIVNDLLAASGIPSKDIAFIVAHQANMNILTELSSRIDIPLDKFVINLDKYGNTAAASVFIAFDELLESGQVKDGDLILLVAFGGGLSWGAVLIRY